MADRTHFVAGISFLLVVLPVVFTLSTGCNVPSRFWCDNVETALKCGVYDQCKNYEWQVKQNAAPVSLVLYYESLCPDCRLFISQQLFPTYNKVKDIFNVTLVPYGNARETKDGNRWKFECQHGKEECEGNLIETCTIAIVKNFSAYFPFINCMEKSTRLPKSAAKKCAQEFPVPLEKILACSTSDMGNQLEHQMALKTEALSPQHQYVPWITLNGVHTEKMNMEATSDLLKLICDTYKGPRPSECPKKM